MKYSIVQLSHPGMEYPKLNKEDLLHTKNQDKQK